MAPTRQASRRSLAACPRDRDMPPVAFAPGRDREHHRAELGFHGDLESYAAFDCSHAVGRRGGARATTRPSLRVARRRSRAHRLHLGRGPGGALLRRLLRVSRERLCGGSAPSSRRSSWARPSYSLCGRLARHVLTPVPCEHRLDGVCSARRLQLDGLERGPGSRTPYARALQSGRGPGAAPLRGEPPRGAAARAADAARASRQTPAWKRACGRP